MSHDEASDLLGAYALDAVDGDELGGLEEHLRTCPRCRSELDGLREVAGALGNSVEVPPEGLWSRIALRLPEGLEPEVEPPPMPRLASGPRGLPGAPSRAPAREGDRRHRALVAAMGAVAVAAAAAVVLGIGLVRADDRASNTQAAPSPVAAALRTPGHRVVALDAGSTGAELAKVVVVPSGQGYLVSSNLPSLGGGRTYQLWAIEGTRPISVGLLGPSPRRAAFTMAGASRPSHLSITAEPAGGSVVPTGPIVASGSV